MNFNPNPVVLIQKPGTGLWISNKNKVKARSFYRTDDIVVLVIVMICLLIGLQKHTTRVTPAVGANVAQVKHVPTL